jgi:hypothetical protein
VDKCNIVGICPERATGLSPGFLTLGPRHPETRPIGTPDCEDFPDIEFMMITKWCEYFPFTLRPLPPSRSRRQTCPPLRKAPENKSGLVLITQFPGVLTLGPCHPETRPEGMPDCERFADIEFMMITMCREYIPLRLKPLPPCAAVDRHVPRFGRLRRTSQGLSLLHDFPGLKPWLSPISISGKEFRLPYVDAHARPRDLSSPS